MVLGTRKSDWKLYIKEAFKENPKNILAGTCFIQGAGEDLKFILQPMRGQASLSKIQKAARGLFKTAKLDAKCIELGAELPLADEEGEDNDSDFSDDQEFDEVESQLDDAADDAIETQEGSKIEPLIKDLQQFQQGLKTLVDGVQNAKSSEDAYAAIGRLYAAFGEFEQKIQGLKKADAGHPAVVKAEANLAALRKMAEQKFGKMIEFMNKVKAEIQKLDQMLKAIPNYAGPSLV
jgi:tetratricopeptide (TPR) repeat protein